VIQQRYVANPLLGHRSTVRTLLNTFAA